MRSEAKSNIRQRKKSEKSNDGEQEGTTKKDIVTNGDENSKQRRQ